MSVTQLTVTEAAGTGRTASYTVKLNTQPTGDVTITPSSSAESAATVSGALTFTTANWSTAQTVTVTGVDDLVDQGDTDRTATISHTVSGGDYGEVSAGTVSVTVTDNDTAGITVTAADPFTVGEGASATYTVQLNTEPSADVVISLTVSGSSEVTIADTDTVMTGRAEHPDLHRRATGTRRRPSPSTRARTTTRWTTRPSSPTRWWTRPAQAVRPGGQRPGRDRPTTTGGITITAASPFTVGGGRHRHLHAELDTQPSGDVVISLTVSGSSEVTVADTDGEMTGVRTDLGHLGTPQTVTVNAGEDDDAVNDAASITRWWTAAAPPYDPVANVDLADGDRRRHRGSPSRPWRPSRSGELDLHGQAQHAAQQRRGDQPHRHGQQRGDGGRHRRGDGRRGAEHPDLHGQRLETRPRP